MAVRGRTVPLLSAPPETALFNYFEGKKRQKEWKEKPDQSCAGCQGAHKRAEPEDVKEAFQIPQEA